MTEAPHLVIDMRQREIWAGRSQSQDTPCTLLPPVKPHLKVIIAFSNSSTDWGWSVQTLSSGNISYPNCNTFFDHPNWKWVLLPWPSIHDLLSLVCFSQHLTYHILHIIYNTFRYVSWVISGNSILELGYVRTKAWVGVTIATAGWCSTLVKAPVVAMVNGDLVPCLALVVSRVKGLRGGYKSGSYSQCGPQFNMNRE